MTKKNEVKSEDPVAEKKRKKTNARKVMGVIVLAAVAVLGYKLWENPKLLYQLRDVWAERKAEQTEYESRAFGKHPNERRSDNRQIVHRARHSLRHLLRRAHSNALREQLAKYQRQIRDNRDNRDLRRFIGITRRYSARALQESGKIVAQLRAGINTRQYAYQRNAYLNGRQETIRFIGQLQCSPRRAVSFFPIGSQT